nr:murein biosynthesis integral membrane protein MurJ [Thiorhodococcus mannitoliphagus]
MSASIAKIGSSTFLSRVLGFARDLIIARLFGADAATDAFFVAFKIPNFARRLFAEGVFSMALVPVLSETKQRRGDTALKGFVDDMAGALTLALLLITSAGLLAAPWLIIAFAPGFAGDAAQHQLATEMLRLTLPYIFFITLAAFAGGILNTYERFGVPAFTPVLLNLILIGCALVVAPHLEEPIMALAWGVLIAGAVQLGFQLPFLLQLGLLPRPRLNLRDPGIQGVFKLVGPAIIGVSVGQISLLLDTLFASFLQTGSISWLYYSDRLMEFPLGILAVALGTVIMPRLSRQHVADKAGDFSRTLDWALRWALLLGTPAALGLLALAEPIMATLFVSDAFVTRDVVMAAQSLMAYAPGVIAFMAIKILVPGYYARQDMHSPVRIALVSIGVGLLLNLLLMLPMGHAGLALATTIAATTNAGLLLRGLMNSGVYAPEQGWTPLLIKVLAASLLMSTALLVLPGPATDWIALNTGARALRLLGWITAGATLYVLTLTLFGVRRRDLTPTA